MYQYILSAHSVFRWLVVLSMLAIIVRSYFGWYFDRKYTLFDEQFRRITTSIVHIQLVLGIILYFVSPLIQFFLSDPDNAMKDRQTRFFGMEHSLVMLMAVIIISAGSVKAKRSPTDKGKFKTTVIWFSAGFVMILNMIPWVFSPMASRPNIRILGFEL